MAQVKIVNLTQHGATPEQVVAGVVEPIDKEAVIKLLTFDDIPAVDEISGRSGLLRIEAERTLLELRTVPVYEGGKIDHEEDQWVIPKGSAAMIGGAPYLMAMLERDLIRSNIIPMYAFSKRESIEETLPNGSVKKIQIFKHVGFVEMSI